MNLFVQLLLGRINCWKNRNLSFFPNIVDKESLSEFMFIRVHFVFTSSFLELWSKDN